MKKVLFLCTGNSCRSQMAEGWAKSLFPDKFIAFSAGVKAEKEVDPLAVRAMREAGVDISAARPKQADIFSDMDFDIVVTLCDHAKETCPVWTGKARKIHRGFKDPPVMAKDAAGEEEAMAHYRAVRDEIRTFVEELASF